MRSDAPFGRVGIVWVVGARGGALRARWIVWVAGARGGALWARRSAWGSMPHSVRTSRKLRNYSAGDWCAFQARCAVCHKREACS